MLVASETLAPPCRAWVRFVGLGIFFVGALGGIYLRHSLSAGRPIQLLVFGVSWLVGVAFWAVHRKGGLGFRPRLRRFARRPSEELTGTLRPVAGDPLAHAAPLAILRPRGDQPGYRSLATRAFDLELEDGHRIRVEPMVAILEAPTDIVPFGTRVAISGTAPAQPSYRERQTVLRGTAETPLVIRTC